MEEWQLLPFACCKKSGCLRPFGGLEKGCDEKQFDAVHCTEEKRIRFD